MSVSLCGSLVWQMVYLPLNWCLYLFGCEFPKVWLSAEGEWRSTGELVKLPDGCCLAVVLLDELETMLILFQILQFNYTGTV